MHPKAPKIKSGSHDPNQPRIRLTLAWLRATSGRFRQDYHKIHLIRDAKVVRFERLARCEICRLLPKQTKQLGPHAWILATCKQSACQSSRDSKQEPSTRASRVSDSSLLRLPRHMSSARLLIPTRIGGVGERARRNAASFSCFKARVSCLGCLLTSVERRSLT